MESLSLNLARSLRGGKGLAGHHTKIHGYHGEVKQEALKASETKEQAVGLNGLI